MSQSRPEVWPTDLIGYSLVVLHIFAPVTAFSRFRFRIDRFTT